jgi:hypothetical protein
VSSGLVLQSGQTYFISASASLREAIGSLNLSIVAPYLGLLGSLAATCLARHNARALPGAGLLPDRRMLITKLGASSSSSRARVGVSLDGSGELHDRQRKIRNCAIDCTNQLRTRVPIAAWPRCPPIPTVFGTSIAPWTNASAS